MKAKKHRAARALRALCALALAAVPAAACAAEQGQRVQMQTSMGDIVIAVDAKKAPKTAENFLQYARDGFFDGLIFHRVIPNFVIQGGGFTPKMEQRQTRPPIVNEDDNGLKNLRYSLSMARTSDPNSATSQFFINLKDNSFLDAAANKRGYAVFGMVVEGQAVVDAIAGVATGNVGPFADVPKEPVVIKKAVVLP